MRKEECINLFNTKLREFISDLSRVYPNDTDLIKFKTTINMVLLVSDKDMIKIFKEYVYEKYNDKILGKDEDFFMEHTYGDELKTGAEYNVTEQLIEKIKSYWTNMTEDNKMTVWSYFILLVKLCARYYSD